MGPKIKEFLETDIKKKKSVDKLKLIHFLLQSKIVDPVTGCWFLENVKNKNKYPHSHGTTFARLSASAFLEFDLDNELRLEICHKCDIKACFNPDHLYVGTHGSNKRDHWKRGARISENHCTHGHEYVIRENGSKVCLECRRNYGKKDSKHIEAVVNHYNKSLVH